MRTLVFPMIGGLLIACGSGAKVPARPRGYAERIDAAREHEAQGRAAQRASHAYASSDGNNYQCGDRVLADQSTSGGKPLEPVMPCWDPTEEAASRLHRRAHKELATAREEREAAAGLIAAEVRACRAMPASELDHSPFAHTKAIAEVIPHRVTGSLEGVRIVFKPILGLDAGWMRQAIACHRARFERMGEPATYLAEDPTLVAGAEVRVEQHGNHVEVVVTSRDDIGRHVALARAQDLLHPQTATR